MSDLSWFRENAPHFAGSLHWDEPLAKHTYYRIGGPADLIVIPKGRDDLLRLREGLMHTRTPFFVLGAGSNILASDLGFRGVIVKTSRIDLDLVASDGLIQAGGSVSVSTLLRSAGKEGWDGFELLAGVPGSVGGVVAMNAGTHLGEAKDRLRKVEIVALLDPTRDRVQDVQESDFSYRKNHFLAEDEVVVRTRWNHTPGEPAAVQARIADVLVRRKASQPLDYPSCGSVFKNPRESGKRAWEVIEALGLRGRQIGQAQFSEKHPNFIVNLGGARAADVSGLIRLAKKEAKMKLNVELHEEVKYLGEHAAEPLQD